MPKNTKLMALDFVLFQH